MPVSNAMTKAIVDRFNDRSHWRQTSQTLNFVCGALVAYDSAQGSDPYAGLDVERVFAAVELLARRKNLEVTPFVSSWHPAVDGWDRSRLPGSWDRRFKGRLDDTRLSDRARDEIVKLIRAVTSGGEGEIYRDLMDEMIAELVTLLATTNKRISYLEPLVRAAHASSSGLTIVTLNYDRSVELAGAASGVAVHTGIEQWAADGRWAWPSTGIRLLKVHGSIDWAWEQLERREGKLSQSAVMKLGEHEERRGRPALVFGHGTKLKAEGPFLSLLAEFEAQLAQSQELVVVGYSFRDDHVNEVVRRWLNESDTNKVCVIDPWFPERPTPRANGGFRDELLSALGSDERAPDGEVRLSIVRKAASVGLLKRFS
ncbi:MAG: hypothetical protein JWQ18_3809 [Conexibacter sp.]|nr:hypothetical protein [Conexibacter sp.]